MTRHPGCQRVSDLDEAGAGHDPAALQELGDRLSPRDPINIQFTSGTTGSPKGATLSHRNIVNNANAATAAMALTEADRLCTPAPFYHCFVMVMGTLGCVAKGGAGVEDGMPTCGAHLGPLEMEKIIAFIQGTADAVRPSD